MLDLRAMGEANATQGRARHFARRKTLRALEDCYQEAFGLADGRIPADVPGALSHRVAAARVPAAARTPGHRNRAPDGSSRLRPVLACVLSPPHSMGPITRSIASAVTTPARSRREGSPVRSSSVEPRRSAARPPSMTSTTWAPRPATTSAAVSGLGAPEGFALGAVSGRPTASTMARAVSLPGMRSETPGAP